MKQIKHTALALLTILLVNCSDDDYSSSSITPTPLRIQATIDNTGWGDATRADDDTESTTTEKSAFADGDQIGISGGGYTNIPYTYKNGSWVPSGDEAIYFDNMYETFVAYYPYAADGTYDDVTAKDLLTVFSATSTPTSVKENNNITFRFKHVVSKLKLELTDIDGDSPNVSLNITGLHLKGSFNISTGVAIGSDSDESFIYDKENGNLIFPNDGTFYVSYDVDYSEINDKWQTLLKSIPVTTKIEAGKSYSYTINVTYFPQVGDYVLSDGSILSRNADNATIKEYLGEGKSTSPSYQYYYGHNSQTLSTIKIVGIVFWLDEDHLNDYESTTSKIRPKHLYDSLGNNVFTYQHDGLMVSLEELSSSEKLAWWSEVPTSGTYTYSTETDETTFANGLGYYATAMIIDITDDDKAGYKAIKVSKDENGNDIDVSIKEKNLVEYIKGKQETQNSAIIKALESESFQMMYKARFNNPLENDEICKHTAFYVPSIYELELLYESETKVTNSINKLIECGFSTDVITAKDYWSSTWTSSESEAYYYNSGKQTDAVTSTHLVRTVSVFQFVNYTYYVSNYGNKYCYTDYNQTQQ